MNIFIIIIPFLFIILKSLTSIVFYYSKFPLDLK